MITWQGGIIEDCSISVRPSEETTNIEQMCLAIDINNIPCDKNVTLKFINRPEGNDDVMVFMNLYHCLSLNYILNLISNKLY